MSRSLLGIGAATTEPPVVLNGATKALAGTLGALVGVSALEHGILEILQGDVRPETLVIDAIGSGQQVWGHASEPAFTVVPNLLVTGILAVILGGVLLVWSAGFMVGRGGPGIFLVLDVAVFLVGGGFAPPIFFGVPAWVVATRIRKPLAWSRRHLSGVLGSYLDRLWPGALIALVVVFLAGVEIAIFGYPLVWWVGADPASAIQMGLAYLMLGLLAVSVLAALARDVRPRGG